MTSILNSLANGGDIWDDLDFFDFSDDFDIFCEQMEEKTAAMTNKELFAAREKAIETGSDVYFIDCEIDSRGFHVPGRDYGNTPEIKDSSKYRNKNIMPIEIDELPF